MLSPFILTMINYIKIVETQRLALMGFNNMSNELTERERESGCCFDKFRVLSAVILLLHGSEFLLSLNTYIHSSQVEVDLIIKQSELVNVTHVEETMRNSRLFVIVIDYRREREREKESRRERQAEED